MSKIADTEPNMPNIPPDREALLDELGRCFVQAAVTRLLEELRQANAGLRDKPTSSKPSKERANADRTATVRRPRKRGSTAARTRRGADGGLDDNKE
jgi:hypothetical protein